MNAVTHWLDGSMIYGSTKEEKERVADGGFLRTSSNDLPPIDSKNDCGAESNETLCFAGGKKIKGSIKCRRVTQRS